MARLTAARQELITKAPLHRHTAATLRIDSAATPDEGCAGVKV